MATNSSPTPDHYSPPGAPLDTPPVQGVPVLKFLLMMLFSTAVGYLSATHGKLGTVPGYIIGASVFGIGIFAVLKLAGSPPGLWLTFGLKFFSVTAYKLVAVVLVSYLIKDCGMKDSQAQWVFGAWGVFMSISTLLAGSITDALGLKRTLIGGLALCLVTRLVMLVSTDPWLTLSMGLIPLAVGEALCTPVLVAATRRFTTAPQRSVAFSIFYAILNFGFMVAYFIRDGVQAEALAGGGRLSLAGWEMSPQQMLFLVSFGLELLAVPFLLLMRDGSREQPGDAPPPALNFRLAAAQTLHLFGSLVRHPGFRRLLIFLLMIGILKIVFNIMDSVLPTFADREIGGEGATRVGRLNAVNSILILILAPLVGMATRKFSAYNMVIFGGFITALSFVFLALPPVSFQSITDGPVGQWIGRGYLEMKGSIHPYLVMILFWQVIFSIGEAFYSPRVYEYAVSIAPQGQEASYASLSAVPLLMGKFINSAAFSGLLTAYCPAEGPRDSSKMWLIGGLLVLTAPILLLVLKPFIRVQEEGR
jgi:dipeptide/tripeptide permease